MNGKQKMEKRRTQRKYFLRCLDDLKTLADDLNSVYENTSDLRTKGTLTRATEHLNNFADSLNSAVALFVKGGE